MSKSKSNSNFDPNYIDDDDTVRRDEPKRESPSAYRGKTRVILFTGVLLLAVGGIWGFAQERPEGEGFLSAGSLYLIPILVAFVLFIISARRGR